MNRRLLLPVLALSVPLAASVRTGGGYSIAAESVAAAGGASSSVNYSQESVAGGVGAISGVGTVVAKGGYPGQLFEIAGLSLSAGAGPFPEQTEFPVTVTGQMTDNTAAMLFEGEVVFGIVSGPLTMITAAGQAHAGAVGRSTPAQISASAHGFGATLEITIADTIPDNYRTYAGDGLPDDWQLDWFGEDNPLAGPLVDATGTLQNNLFKYHAGLNPVDGLASNARFTQELKLVPGQPTARQLVFRPVYPDRNYTVQVSDDLVTWAPVASAVTSTVGEVRSVTDPNGAAAKKFYRVDVVKP